MSWCITADGRATQGDRTLTGATPAELWRALASELGSVPAHLHGRADTPLPAGIAAAEAERTAQHLDAIVGRVRDPSGRLTPRLGRLETIRQLDLGQGALLVTGPALARAAATITRGWDGYWARDLVDALHRTSALGSTGAVLAESAARAPPIRLPPSRASTLAPTDDQSTILVYGAPGASISLYFDGLPPAQRARLRFLAPGDLSSDFGWLASAGLVIVVRGFEHMLEAGTLALLTELGIPYVWFTDDHLGRLARESPGMAFYTDAVLQKFTACAACIVASSPALVEALRPYHSNTLIWPPVFDPALAPPPAYPSPEYRVAAFGGAFRRASFIAHVHPALTALHLPTLAVGDLGRGLAGVDTVPFQPSFARFVFDWRRQRPRALVHPYGETENIGNKSAASLFVAAYLGAVPIVGDEPAYAGIGEAEGVLKAGRAATEWQSVLARLADPAEADMLSVRLQAWARTHFAAGHATPAFEQLASLALPGGVAAESRWQAAGQSRALNRALATPDWSRRLKRLATKLRRRLPFR